MRAPRSTVPIAAVMLALTALTAPATADAPRIEIGGGMVAASETTSPKSAGYGGGAVSIARWENRFGLAVEAGIHDWEASSYNTWLGVDARIALLDGRKACPQGGMWARTSRAPSRSPALASRRAPSVGRGGDDGFGSTRGSLGDSSRTGGWPDGAAPTPNPPASSTCTLLGRLWLELGVARELWHVNDDIARNVTRNRYSIGGGTDLGTTRVFDSIFFRVQRANPLRAVDRFGDTIEQTYETSLVFGMSLMFGR